MKDTKHGAKASAQKSTKNKLQITTPSDRELVITRAFDAPRALVWDALTKPELVKRWLVRTGWSFPVCEIDLRVGGAYRYLWRKNDDGFEMGMRGVYREIVRPERIVATEVFDDAWYPGDALDTWALVERGGTTTLTTTVLYASKEVRDAVLKSPMEKGLSQNYDNLETLLASTATGKTT